MRKWFGPSEHCYIRASLSHPVTAHHQTPAVGPVYIVGVRAFARSMVSYPQPAITFEFINLPAFVT